MPTAWRTSAASPRSRKLLVDAGLIVLVSLHLAVPRRAPDGARDSSSRASSSRSTSIRRSKSAEQRDPKGLYAKARHGEIQNFTGIDRLRAAPQSGIAVGCRPRKRGNLADRIIHYLRHRGILG